MPFTPPLERYGRLRSQDMAIHPQSSMNRTATYSRLLRDVGNRHTFFIEGRGKFENSGRSFVKIPNSYTGTENIAYWWDRASNFPVEFLGSYGSTVLPASSLRMAIFHRI